MGTQKTRDRPQVTQMVSALHLIVERVARVFSINQRALKALHVKQKRF